MIITEVRIDPAAEAGPLLAWATIVFDDSFIIKDVKLLRGTDGRPFISMPRRAVRDHCRRCGKSIDVTSAFCPSCGLEQGPVANRVSARDNVGRLKVYVDIAHPIRRGLREAILEAVLDEWEAVANGEAPTGRDNARAKFGTDTDGT